jgi:hypothetical protein
MVGADVGRAILTALIPLSVDLGLPTMAVIVLVAAPLRTFHAFFRAAYIASLPAIVGRGHLPRANGIVETVESTALIVGPAIAGLLAAAIGSGLTLAIDAASFAASAVGLLLINRDLRAAAGRPQTRILDDVREGFVFILHNPVLRATILLFSASRPSSHRSFLRSPSDHARPPSRRAVPGASPRRRRGRRARSSPAWSPNTGRRRPARRGLRDGSRPDRNRSSTSCP